MYSWQGHRCQTRVSVAHSSPVAKLLVFETPATDIGKLGSSLHSKSYLIGFALGSIEIGFFFRRDIRVFTSQRPGVRARHHP